MIRRRIVRTLLYKEALRYRYNWGLLVMVVALLALAALVSISARLKKLPGQGGQAVETCYVAYNPGDAKAKQWADFLAKAPVPDGLSVRFMDADRLPRVSPQAMIIRLQPPWSGAPEAWKVRYEYSDESAAGTFPYRDWFVQETKQFLHSSPSFAE